MADASPPDARRLAVDRGRPRDRRRPRRRDQPGVPRLRRHRLGVDPARASSSRPHHMPNRFVFSRDSNRSSAPYLTVRLGPRTSPRPPRPAGLASRRRPTSPPARRGPPGRRHATTGRPGRSASSSTRRRQGRAALPDPARGRPGERVRMHLRDLGLAAGQDGPPGGPGRRRRRERRAARPRPRSASPASDARPLPGASPTPFRGTRAAAPARRAPRSRSSTSWTRSSPSPATMIPPQPAGYLAANHLWDAASRGGSGSTRPGTSSSPSRS